MSSVNREILKIHDVSDIIGLHVIVLHSVIEITDEDGEKSYEIPELDSLGAAAALARCLTPYRLKGSELRAIRKIAGWTASDLAKKLGEKTSVETISRWENDKQLMGSYAEKVFRLVVCEEIAKNAEGIYYKAKSIADMSITDPWLANSEYEMHPICLALVKIMSKTERLIDTYRLDCEAA